MLQRSATNRIMGIQGTYGHRMSDSDAIILSLPCTPALDLRAEYSPKGKIGFSGTVPRIRLSC